MPTRNICIAQCLKCGKEYKYQVQDWGYPGGKEREYAYCPYCKTPSSSEVTNGVIKSWKIEDDSNAKA